MNQSIPRTNSSTHLIARLERNPNDAARTIDEFYDEAGSNDTKPQASQYWLILLAMGIAHSGDATEILSMNFVLSNERFANEILKGDFATRGSILAACVFAGMFFGGLLTGAYSDQIGRRPILLLGLTLNSVSGLASALVPNIFFMSLCRFTAGTGVGAILSTLMTLATESSPPSKRGRNVGYVSTFFTFGTIYVAVLALFLFGKHHVSWRIFVAFCALPVLCGNIMIYFLVPESARFLAFKHLPDEACISANRIADAMGYQGPPLKAEEVKYHYHNPTSIDREIGQRRNVGATLQKAINCIRDLYSPKIRCTTITLQLLWISLSFGSGLITWINMVLKQIHVANLYMDSLYFSMATIPGNVAAALLMDKVGRKKMLVSSMFLCSASLFFFARAAEYGNSADKGDSGHSAVISACFFHAFIVITWTATNVSTSELFPTEVRSTGLGVCAATGRLAAMFAQYVNGSLINEPGVLLSVTSLVILFGGCCLFFLRDTSNQPLPDRITESDVKRTTDLGMDDTGSSSYQPLMEKIICKKSERKPTVELV